MGPGMSRAAMGPEMGAGVALGMSPGGAGAIASMSPGQFSITTSHFEIPAHKVKDVLGVRGRNVKAIKQKSGILKIGIIDRSDPATVTVTGTHNAIETCRFMVLAIASGDQTVIGNTVETLEIDQRIVSKLIGPKGQVISQIKDQSGAYLEVRETGDGQAPKVVMTGPPDCVDKAKKLISRVVTEHNEPSLPLGAAVAALAAAGAAAPAGAGSGSTTATAAAAAAAATAVTNDPYTQYFAQAKLQEAQIHVQLQQACLQAQLQEAQVAALATAQAVAQLGLQAASAADLQRVLYAAQLQTGDSDHLQQAALRAALGFGGCGEVAAAAAHTQTLELRAPLQDQTLAGMASDGAQLPAGGAAMGTFAVPSSHMEASSSPSSTAAAWQLQSALEAVRASRQSGLP